MHANHLWPTHVERETRHHVYSVCAAHTDSNHTETTSVWSVTICTNHHPTRERIVFENDLMNDATTWTPETNTVLLRRRL